METTLVIIKPDAVQRELIGPIIERFERKGLRIAGAKFIRVPRDLAEQHYAEHAGKPFYDSLLDFITSSPVMVLAIRGSRETVPIVRKIVGATDGAAAEPGTIRGDFGMSKTLNLIHASDSPQSAQRELAMWFNDDEIVDYDLADQRWIDPG
ncbi:MAG: nucleoside-diphosphate kinase [Planctomycetaceae bacterium]|nr:nucleoside-diphosphate kinase [Planctomycetaceae bacterium]